MRRQTGEAFIRLSRMRPARIAPQISPVGMGRVFFERAAPEQRLATGGKDRAHAARLGGIGIGGQKLLIAAQRVSLHRGGVGVIFRETLDRATAHFREGRLSGRRRRVRGAFENVIGCDELRSAPWELRAAARLVHREAGLRENVFDRDAALTHRARQSFCVGAVRTRLVGGDRSRRCVEREEFAGLRLHQGESAREWRAGPGVRVRSRAVEYDDFRARPGADASACVKSVSLTASIGTSAPCGSGRRPAQSNCRPRTAPRDPRGR